MDHWSGPLAAVTRFFFIHFQTHPMNATFQRLALALSLVLAAPLSFAQGQSAETLIQKRIQERIPEVGRIDEVRKSPMPGLYEVRVDGTELFYSDAKGDYLIRGEIFDTRKRSNLTQQRANELLSIAWKDLPLKDAFAIKRGNGQRQLAVFADPNCGYCKKLEKELQTLNDVTIYLFLYPVLGPSSTQRSENIWCAKDKGKAWDEWMLQGVEAPKGQCDTSAIERNLAFGRKHKITGTPTLVLAKGTRIPGFVTLKQLEEAMK